MNRILLTALLAGFLFLNCKRESVRVDAPAGIKALISNDCDPSCPSYINEYEWKDQLIYMKTCGGVACLCLASFYNDKGEPLPGTSIYNTHEVLKEARLIRLVWRCESKR